MRPIAIIRPECSRYEYEYRLFIVPTRRRDALIYELRAFTPRSKRGILATAISVGIDQPLSAHRYARKRAKLYAEVIGVDAGRACEMYRSLDRAYGQSNAG